MRITELEKATILIALNNEKNESQNLLDKLNELVVLGHMDSVSIAIAKHRISTLDVLMKKLFKSRILFIH